MLGLTQARYSVSSLALPVILGLSALIFAICAQTASAAQSPGKATVSSAAKTSMGSAAKATVKADPRLIIPKLRLNAPLGSRADKKNLARGPAHIQGTSRPGESGNVGISGHRTMHTRPFSRLDSLRPGDLVILGTETGDIRYRVAWKKVVRPNAVHVLASTKVPSVTLTTCTPEGSAKFRLVVRAVLAES